LIAALVCWQGCFGLLTAAAVAMQAQQGWPTAALATVELISGSSAQHAVMLVLLLALVLLLSAAASVQPLSACLAAGGLLQAAPLTEQCQGY
jgi:hypothetical protein